MGYYVDQLRIGEIGDKLAVFVPQFVDIPAAAECLYYYAGWSGKVTGETIPIADNDVRAQPAGFVHDRALETRAPGQGFDPRQSPDPVYMDSREQAPFTRLDDVLYQRIQHGELRF